jgi:hypothetical protein
MLALVCGLDVDCHGPFDLTQAAETVRVRNCAITASSSKSILAYSNGAVADCATSAGRGENMDSALAFGLAYDAAFGWREADLAPRLAYDVVPRRGDGVPSPASAFAIA